MRYGGYQGRYKWKEYFAKDTEMNYTVTNGKVEIETNSDLQRMLNRTSLSNQLIYSSFYCEK